MAGVPQRALPWVSIASKYVNMTDLNSLREAPGPKGHEADRDMWRTASAQQRVAMVELLFFAYRDFTGEADEILGELKFGRAHHRVLHFVNRNPGLRVADLLGILKITKQSLARVLKQLVDEGHVRQTAGPVDRRERRLHTTDKGRALADTLLKLQTRRLGEVLDTIGPEAAAAAEAFLFGVISPDERGKVETIVRRNTD